MMELNGFALQAEFGNYDEREHGARDYFLLEHYVPESMVLQVDGGQAVRTEIVRSHRQKAGIDEDKAEEEFILIAQQLPHYGGHFYTAEWVNLLPFISFLSIIKLIFPRYKRTIRKRTFGCI